MARLRRAAGDISGGCLPAARETVETDSPPTRPTRRKPTARYIIAEDSDEEEEPVIRKKKQPTVHIREKAASQIRLAPLQSLSSLSDLTIQDDTPEKTRRRSPLKRDARRMIQKNGSATAKFLEDIPLPAQVLSGSTSEGRDEELVESEQDVDEEVDVEESIWCGSEPNASASEGELPSPTSFFPVRRKGTDQKQPDLARQLEALSIFDADPGEAPTRRSAAKKDTSESKVRPGSSSDKENQDAIIKFSPPRFKKPVVARKDERPSTPPPPPASPTKLRSPTKRPPRIPTPPGRPSLEAFWTASAVNDWNDQYSPQKPIRSPRKLFEPQTKLFDDTPIASPAKLSSPTKRSKAELEARKDWEIRKIFLAQSFLDELDQTITQGRIAALSASTGGVQIIWSKTLNSTAGRANWRRETTKSHHSSNNNEPTKATITTHKHFATIELASKVLTYSPQAETQLLNVLAHEFCHLANFMISGIKDQPHGTSFKSWGRKCSQAFQDREIEVTTKHSYEIEYKYVWKCVEEEACGMEFKRHSKSIDPKRHRCGGCKATLVQVKPVPRRGGGAVAKKNANTKVGHGGSGTSATAAAPKLNGYAAYVKQHFAGLKRAMAGASHKEVMEALGRQYRAEKAAAVEESTATAADADTMAEKLANVKLNVEEIIVLDD
ncbi:hypothetical protein BST61_g2451 [Cercospora zeina]